MRAPSVACCILSRIVEARFSRLLILGAALLFSTGGAVIKATSLSGWQVACFRSAIAALTLLVFMPAWRRWWEPRALAVGAAYAATLILYVLANNLTTAANAIFLQSTAPLYVLLLGPRLLGERTRASDLAFTSLLFGGILLFFLGAEPPRITAPHPERGNWLGLASGLFWALTLIGLRWLGRRDVPGARHAFLGELRERMEHLDRSAHYATYCASGFRASIAASLLAANGFQNIRNVPGSWKAWTSAGYPEETPKNS